jgi:hypothetical protein
MKAGLYICPIIIILYKKYVDFFISQENLSRVSIFFAIFSTGARCMPQTPVLSVEHLPLHSRAPRSIRFPRPAPPNPPLLSSRPPSMRPPATSRRPFSPPIHWIGAEWTGDPPRLTEFLPSVRRFPALLRLMPHHRRPRRRRRDSATHTASAQRSLLA